MSYTTIKNNISARIKRIIPAWLRFKLVRFFVQGAYLFDTWPKRALWGTCVILFIGIVMKYNKREALQLEYGKLVSSAEYRHAMVPKFIHDIPPEQNNGPTPIVIPEMPKPISDARHEPMPVKEPTKLIKTIDTPKMEDSVHIESADIGEKEWHDIMKNHRKSIIKVTRLDNGEVQIIDTSYHE